MIYMYILGDDLLDVLYRMYIEVELLVLWEEGGGFEILVSICCFLFF